MKRHAICWLIAMVLVAMSPTTAKAQLLDRLKDATKRGVERAIDRETEKRADELTTDAIDAVICAVTDLDCIERARQDGRDIVVTDENGDALPEQEQAEVVADADKRNAERAEPARPGEDSVWANYDFVPGDRPLFIEDFDNEFVGDVPRRIGFVSGNMETAEWQGGQLLRITSDSGFTIDLPETLPERFTIEFDMYAPNYWDSLCLATGTLDDPSEPFTCFHGRAKNYSSAYFTVSDNFQTGIRGGSGGVSHDRQAKTKSQLTPIRIMADGSYAKMYLDETRVVNVPNASLERSNQIHVYVIGEVSQEEPVYIDNVRIASGGREILYDRLMADGRFATQGILFATGSARIRPESTPTLKEIARTMKRYTDLRLRIEGHTDNTGSATTNKTLSKARAEAVREYLMDAYDIPANQLEADGFGAEKPVAENGTPEGRQQNRRVELVRLNE
ncbi:MAG: OmpA family protein [Pseudomonadota bacterium]